MRLLLFDAEPRFFFGEADLDFTNGLEVFVEFFVVAFVDLTLHRSGVGEDGVENTALFHEALLAFGEGGVIVGKEAVEGGDGGVEGRDGFSGFVPGEGEAGAVSIARGAGVTP